MKALLLVAGSRAGSDFFQSLLDGHSQVLQFPGLIKTNKTLIRILLSDNANDICSNFIKNYPHFFDSRLGYGKVERHDALGENKNQYYLVDQEKFKINFIKMFEKKCKINKHNKIFELILMLHQAYALTCGQNISKKKIMIINCHIVEWTKYFGKKIDNVDFDIIHTIRNPLSAVSSPVNHWLNYDAGKSFFAKSIYFQLDLIVNGIKKLKKLNKRIFLVQLEMLHKRHFHVMDDFCKTYNLNYENSMQYATFFNLQFWGDKISGQYLTGVNKNFKISFNEETFYKRDIKFLEYILNDYIKFYGYQFTGVTSKIFFNLIPMKCEILTWKNSFKHKRIKHILSIPFFYIKRLLYINKFSQKDLKMPHSFGTELKNNIN